MNMLRDMITGNDLELVRAKLTDIDETINDTAVDVFIYDTSKDSDGGAWRHRTQHTSWYNETLDTDIRGIRKEFPAVAVIVAEAYRVTIYDGDDPSLPMWMVFNVGFKYSIHSAAPITSVAMKNGELRVGVAGSGVGNLSEISFLADKSGMRVNSTVYYYIRSALSQRNTSVVTEGTISAGLVNRDINDVAMTVLPDAPTDPATGLPVPTIAVATGGGLSVIKDDGTVVNPFVTDALSFVQEVGNDFSFGSTGTHVLYFSPAPAYASVGNRFWASDYFTGDRPYASATDAFSGWRHLAAANGQVVAGSSAANTNLAFLSEFPADDTQGMVAYTTSSYTTGWMNGDIKLAALADTTAETLSGTPLLDDDFSSGTTGWTFEGTATDTSTAGFLSGTTGGASNLLAHQTITTEAGKTYTLEVTTGPVSSAIYVGAGAPGGINLGSSGFGTNATLSTTFVATGTTTYISAMSVGGSANVSIDNISVRLADPDRSVNGKGLAVHGSITKAPVATGADVVAYSNFSTSNYLEQPYNPDLDFGQGDFCLMAWVYYRGGSGRIVHRANGSSSLNRYAIDVPSSGAARIFTVGSGPSAECEGTGSLPTDVWSYVCGVRRNEVLEIYVNGVLQNTAVSDHDVSNASATLNVGANSDGTGVLFGSLALLRISATAPTADQIRKIYEDERPLFQENAKATLTGNSDAVTALAHDPDTNLLHVGTPGGRSVFQGLRRVEEHTGTNSQSLAAISAVDGLVVEGK